MNPKSPVTAVTQRPRYEGSNIETWIGFKHVMYLVEEAVLQHLRNEDLPAQEGFELSGLRTDIIDSNVRIASALHIDDEVVTEVTPTDGGGDGSMTVSVLMHAQRGDRSDKILTGTVRVARRQDVDWPPLPQPVPLGMREPTRLTEMSAPVGDVQVRPNAVVWKWRIPYFYCHFNKFMQHSGYLRVMEEVVDLFLAHRGVSIRRMLQEDALIPVVPRARLQIIEDAFMEEELITVFTVTDIFKDLTYTAEVECFVDRGGEMTRVASGEITHGYAEIHGPGQWHVVPFGDRLAAGIAGAER